MKDPKKPNPKTWLKVEEKHPVVERLKAWIRSLRGKVRNDE